MIAYFKNLVEFKIKFRSNAFWTAVLLGGWIFTLLIPPVPAAFDEDGEEVPVINRTPDKSNPLYETDQVEGGVSFYVPKGTAFVKKYGVISPVDPQEYLVKKIEGMKRQMEVLSKRIDALEENASIEKDQKLLR